MIFRPSQKLARKIKVPALRPAAADPSPFADWSAHVFSVRRRQYLLLTNTSSLYSTVIPGRGISSDRQLVDRAVEAISEAMARDGLLAAFRSVVAPEPTVTFASALNRSVTGSMNELVGAALLYLDDDLSLLETSCRLNDMPMSYLKWEHPRDVLRAVSMPPGE